MDQPFTPCQPGPGEGRRGEVSLAAFCGVQGGGRALGVLDSKSEDKGPRKESVLVFSRPSALTWAAPRSPGLQHARSPSWVCEAAAGAAVLRAPCNGWCGKVTGPRWQAFWMSSRSSQMGGDRTPSEVCFQMMTLLQCASRLEGPEWSGRELAGAGEGLLRRTRWGGTIQVWQRRWRGVGRGRHPGEGIVRYIACA